MEDHRIFKPPLLLGLVFHSVAILILLLAGGWGLWRAVRETIGPGFVLYLIPSLLAMSIVPLLTYRAYALRRASYHLERDGIRLRWGLRAEDIPIDTVLWVHRSSELNYSLPLPWFRWPGAVLGVRRMPDGKSVEFMAGESNRLVVIATEENAYAISPEDPETFLQEYQNFIERGSLSPFPAYSEYPGFLVARIWRSRPARYLLLGGVLLNLILLVWISLLIPSASEVILGFAPTRQPVPPVRLLLLPFMSLFFFLLDMFLGLFFFRRGEMLPESTSIGSSSFVSGQVLAYLLWSSGVVTAVLFLISVLIIQRAG